MPWHYNTNVDCGLVDHDLAQRRRQGDAEGGKREAGRGTRSGAQQEAFAVLFDLGLGQRVEVSDDGGPRGAGAVAHGGEAVFQLLLQHQREEAAGDVTADRPRGKHGGRPRLEQAFWSAKRPLGAKDPARLSLREQLRI